MLKSGASVSFWLKLNLISVVIFAATLPGYGQVGPAEMVNSQLKAAEREYLPQLAAVNRAVSEMSFPFAFRPSRYAGLDPKDQIGADARGLEFVHFHGRLVLKMTGNYNAAFNASLLTPNQRANRVFDEVILPILRILPEYFKPADHFDAFGFEISYHTRTGGRGYEYEGKEILVAVLGKADALAFTDLQFKRQEALDRSEIFLDGKPFGLALGSRDPFEVETLARSLPAQRVPAAEQGVAPQPVDVSTREGGDKQVRPVVIKPPPSQLPAPKPVVGDSSAHRPAMRNLPEAGPDPEELQKKYQAQLDDLAREGVAKHHFVDYAPPSFVLVRNQVSLQFTMKNPAVFDQDATSIYRRAAQSFDLFLAPQLKPVLDKIPASPELAALDVTVIDQLAGKSGASSEAVEFIFPVQPLRRFVDSEITNQDLINQSLVLVNGVRISLNLQLVE